MSQRGDSLPYVHEIPTPERLGNLLLALIRDIKPHIGIGTPATTRWLFPGASPSPPKTSPNDYADSASELRPDVAPRSPTWAPNFPAGVLADLLSLHPTTAVRWMREGAGDWTRYAVELARTCNHQP